MNKKGFTLVELLLAATLFLAGTVAFGHLLKTGLTSVGSAGRYHRAVNETRAEMESLAALPFNQLPARNGSKFAAGDGSVRIIPVLADLVKVQLELAWDEKKVPLRLVTLRSSY